DLHRPPDDAVWFLSLGGAGEIGMNLNLYGTAGKWLMVDCGITFGDETTPGVEIIMPNIGFIADRRDDLVGIVVTHGHEDHIGAIPYLWTQLQCPIYATKFTAELIRNKLAQMDLKARIIEIPKGGTFEVGPFKGEFIGVTHSIPESQMLAIATKHGTVLHTGDWKLDPEPIVGDVTNSARLKELGAEGLMALVGDSTNALVPGRSGSEREVQDGLNELFKTLKKRIVVTCFSSNVARLKSVAIAAKKAGRYVTLVGRSMWRNAETAEECGYLPEFKDFLSENEAMLSPRDNIVFICTGCQGEPRSALPRIVGDDHPEVELDSGDAVIFSSREIPGNEKAIAKLQNRLIAQGLQVITQDQAFVHVSGHPAQDEIAELYQWTRPKLVLPVHGEARHQMEHARIAKECQVPATLIPQNGQIIRLGPGIHEVVTEVPHGRMGLDGRAVRPLDHEATKNRRKMSYNGAAVITLVMDARGVITREPQVALMGLADEGAEGPLQGDIVAAIQDAVEAMPKSTRIDDAAVRHAVAAAARRIMKEVHGKKPITEVHVVRI
ncbi:MAG TPA: ribonuclease J, partial [Alphaproteobacteria bacterium]|nr:ribonuclease J [Alphaproteobacteria bacterium]